MKYLIILLFACSMLNHKANAAAGRPSYSALTIPEELKKDANAVIRIQTDRMEVVKYNKATFTRHLVVTVLNQRGADIGYEEIFYDKFEKVKGISGKLYDKNGTFVRTLSSTDIKDYSFNNDFSVFIDTRIKIAGMRHYPYPYTVELTFEVAYNGLMIISPWTPVEGENISVEKAEFYFTTPNEIECKYQNNNINFLGAKKSEDITTYHWMLENYRAKKRKPFSPSLQAQNPFVKITLSKFKIEGYEGEGTDWKSLGGFTYNLNDNRDQLTEDVLTEVKTIASAALTNREKVKALYTHLQQTTRYVNISLGIGGWQTHEAKYVCKNKYGDCKALTNYMKAQLKAVGIESYQALIVAGDDAGITDVNFPSLHFNHVILFVPDGKDTIWLECTNQQIAFGQLGNSCQARWALALHPSKSKLVRTPESSFSDNVVASNAIVRLNKDGSAACKMTFRFTGFFVNHVKAFIDKSRKEQEQWMSEMFEIPSIQIHEYGVNMIKDKEEAELNIMADLPQYGSTSATKIFVYLNLLNREHQLPESTDERKESVVCNTPYTYIDTITYELPAGTKIERIKQDSLDIKSSFGSYYSSALADERNSTITYTRNFSINRFNFPPDKYEALRTFFADIVTRDQAQVILIK